MKAKGKNLRISNKRDDTEEIIISRRVDQKWNIKTASEIRRVAQIY